MPNALLLTQLLIDLISQAQQVGALLNRAHAENRDVTDEELARLFENDDKAKAKLQALIDSAS